ncbi:MAG: DUF1573 domain-containing protein [Sphingobacteriales bacterium JAD_PAG50586_3]|nr:MAG: DUF1573 domain-containing protein [Sphingobacteriales bacterium JAD_PAG50586_3]
MKTAIGIVVFLFSQLAYGQTTSIAFETTDYKFGTVKEGKVITYSYKFKNTGKANFKITSVDASCDCMVPTLPSAPVKPGETGVIKVVFNTAGQGKAKRPSSKSITITGNTIPAKTSLYMQGYVLPKR